MAVSASCLCVTCTFSRTALTLGRRYRNLKPTTELLRSLLDPTNRPYRELDRLKSLLQSVRPQLRFSASLV